MKKLFNLFCKENPLQEVRDMNVIDLSDNTQYPACVLADLNYTFALEDDSRNMLAFLQSKWLQPSFHWGWDDYTHEEAVKSAFLFRAFSAMNSQYRKRRDGMIASEGCRFVWMNKNVEPVPGILSGDEFCDIMNRSLERDLGSIKSINAYEDRNIRRSKLNPVYEDLMAELEKSEDEADYHHRHLGCDMMSFTSKSYGNRQYFIVNTILKKAYKISDSNGKLVGFTKDDIDWENVERLEHNADAYRLQSSYYFGINDYKDGLARVDWTLYPDGRYFADETGFGMEDNDEVNVYAYIDTECRVVVKFKGDED